MKSGTFRVVSSQHRIISYFLHLLLQFGFMIMDQQQVKLLVTFSTEVNLDHLIMHLTSDYLFIQQIKKYTKNELLITFDSMLDLLEIDFTQQFGAIATKVKNSNSFCKEMNEQQPPSTEDWESSSPVSSNNIDYFQTENIPHPPQLKGKLERLTSLEDEVNEEQAMIKKLALFDQTDGFSRNEENSRVQEPIEELLEEFEPEQQKQKDSIWAPIVNGVVLTSLLVGGVKAIKFFFR